MQSSYAPHQNRANQAYKTSSYHGRSEMELMTELFGKLVKQLYLAQDAYTQRAFDVMNNHNIKTLHTLDVLREELLASSAFTDEDAKNAARFLLATYTDVIRRLSLILSAESPKDEFAALIEKMTGVYRAWQTSAPKTDMPANVEPASSALVGAI